MKPESFNVYLISNVAKATMPKDTGANKHRVVAGHRALNRSDVDNHLSVRGSAFLERILKNHSDQTKRNLDKTHAK